MLSHRGHPVERGGGAAAHPRPANHPACPASLTDFEANPPAQEPVRERLRAFPGYAQVRAVQLLLESWTIENGLLTRTLKGKRERLETRFEVAIDGLNRHQKLPR
jgi:long-chain acyl-CoA synthetase